MRLRTTPGPTSHGRPDRVGNGDAHGELAPGEAADDVSGQCGFASTEEGNILSEDEQWAKLARIVEVADEVWG